MNPEDRKPYTEAQRQPLAWGLMALAEAVASSNDPWRVDNGVEKAMRYLNEFIGGVKPSPTLTEAQAEFSCAAHTYMRKGMDSPLGCLLYRAVSDNKGEGVWRAFVIGAVANLTGRHTYREAIHHAEAFFRSGPEAPADVEMLYLLKMFEDDFDQMLKTFKEGDWIEWPAKTKA